MITRHIAELLYFHECVIVPGLGGFIKADKPATIIHTSHEFYPPSATVAFNASLSANDGILVNYIASSTSCSYREALIEVRQWVESVLDLLKNGERISFEGIGDLFVNTSGKLEFKPLTQLNFNTDSFGLSVFVAKTVENNIFIPEIQVVRHARKNSSLRHLLPETLKWAAVLAPFVAFVLWGSISGNLMDNYVHNYTGMYSWARSTPGKTVPYKIAEPSLKVEATPQQILKSPASILAEENSEFEPGMVSYAELAKNNIKISVRTEVAPSKVVSAKPNFYIIGGAFRDHNNALKLIGTLQLQGYPAQVIDTTPSGLYIVSINGFNTYSDAAIQLKELKNSGFSSSWILKKQKV